MRNYTPSLPNVLRLYRWVRSPASNRRVYMDWNLCLTQHEARRFLRHCLHTRITRGAPVNARQADYPERPWRKLRTDYQIMLIRDAQAVRMFRQERIRNCGVNPTRLFHLDDIRRRLHKTEIAYIQANQA